MGGKYLCVKRSRGGMGRILKKGNIFCTIQCEYILFCVRHKRDDVVGDTDDNRMEKKENVSSKNIFSSIILTKKMRFSEEKEK